MPSPTSTDHAPRPFRSVAGTGRRRFRERPVARAGRQDQRPNEVRRTRGINPVLGQLEDVLPEPLELLVLPRVGPLIERNLVLLGTLQQLLERCLPRRNHSRLLPLYLPPIPNGNTTRSDHVTVSNPCHTR
jgi:hypothetical protein